MTDFTVEVDVNNWNDGGVWRRSSFSGGLASGVLLVTGGNGGGDCSTLSSTLLVSGSVGLYDFSPVTKQSSPRGQTFDNFRVTVVPEPSKAMLILSGLALVGVSLRASQARARWTPIRGSCRSKV